MKKFSILLFMAILAASCSVGTYYPYAQNNFGAQSKVILKKANFRVVRDVEAIVDINNTRLSRADVASSAYGELLRKAQLTGSQVLINVVIEEVRRESGGFFRLLFGMPKRVQHVAARATIIEFLDKDGNPTVSQSYRPTYTHATTVLTQPTHNDVNTHVVQEVETQIHQQSTQPLASAEEIQKCDIAHQQILRLSSRVFFGGKVLSKYNNIYKNLYKTKENVQKIQKIQLIVISYLNSKGTAYPNLENQLKNASSAEEEIQIFLSYSQE